MLNLDLYKGHCSRSQIILFPIIIVSEKLQEEDMHPLRKQQDSRINVVPTRSVKDNS